MLQTFTDRMKQTIMLTGRCLLVGISLISLWSLLPRQWRVRAFEPNHGTLQGQWRGASFPVENFQMYTSPFGLRQSPDGAASQEYHRGLDLAAPEGSYVRNWWSGTVVEVTDNTACGTSVVVQSGPWEHIYCHMKGQVENSNGRLYLSDRDGGIQIWHGQTVAAGARIGRVGTTGRTTGPHLHWGLKYQGEWIDPAIVLRAMYSEQTGQQAAVRRP